MTEHKNHDLHCFLSDKILKATEALLLANAEYQVFSTILQQIQLYLM